MIRKLIFNHPFRNAQFQFHFAALLYDHGRFDILLYKAEPWFNDAKLFRHWCSKTSKTSLHRIAAYFVTHELWIFWILNEYWIEYIEHFFVGHFAFIQRRTVDMQSDGTESGKGRATKVCSRSRTRDDHSIGYEVCILTTSPPRRPKNCIFAHLANHTSASFSS